MIPSHSHIQSRAFYKIFEATKTKSNDMELGLFVRSVIQNYLDDKFNYPLELGVSQSNKHTSCSLCHGNSYKTLGGGKCEECGIDGTKPWGG